MEAARSMLARDISNKSIFVSSTGRTILADDIETIDNESRQAASTLHSSVGLRILGALPLLREQRNGIDSVVEDVGTTAAVGGELLQHVNSLVERSHGTSVSLSALRSLQEAIENAQRTVKHLNQSPAGLIGPVASVRRQLDVQLAKISSDLQRGVQTISYALPFLGADGDRTYLIAGENNAEMRDQGAVLSLALLRTHDGSFTVTTSGSVDDIEPTQPVDVSVPPATTFVFNGYGPTELWQSVNASASFPLSAQIMQAMYAQRKGVHVNGVIALDVPALQSLLNLTGPVTVPGISGLISAQNVAVVILHDQYLQYPATDAAQEVRHDNISAVAKAVVKQLKNEHVDLAALGNALASDVAGRHLMVWDSRKAQEARVSSLGASGSIDATDPSRAFHIAVENSTATKLDYYVTDSINSHVEITANGNALIHTTVTVFNGAPAGQGPSFQTGPDGINSHVPGQYVARVFLWSPRGSDTPQSIPESGLRVSQTQVSVLPQQSETVSFATLIRHAVVNGRFELHYVPQPRLVPSTLRVEVSASGWQIDGVANFALPLDDSTTLTWPLSK